MQSKEKSKILVSTEWVLNNLDKENIKIVESNEDVLLYSTGHIPGAIHIDWQNDLNNQLIRDYVNGKEFSILMSEKGIKETDTIIIYGDNNNWWATYTLWVFKLFGHKDVRIMNGGRKLWIAENKTMSKEIPKFNKTNYPIRERDDQTNRIFRDELKNYSGKNLVDVRSHLEYTGERTHMPDYPQEGAMRGGHIPGAFSIPWSTAVNDDGTFKTDEELMKVYGGLLENNEEIIVYCRIGERSSHTWFVLKYLLGAKSVRNYDGSWTEWGNLVGSKIVKGKERI